MTKRLLTFAASTVIALALCTPALRADDKPSSIDQLAPENSVLVVGAKNLKESMDRLKTTRLWDFWQSPHGQKLREKFDEGMKDAMKEMADELEMDMQEMPMPSGAAGFALFIVNDDDTGMTKPGILAFADFGEDSEKAFALLQKFMEKGENEGEIRTEALDLVGREGWHVEMIKHDEQADDQANEDDMDMGAPSGPPFDAIDFIKEGTMLMVSTDKDALEQALHARDGEDIKSVADREEHKAIKAQIGEGEIYGTLLMRDFWEAFGAVSGGGGGMTMFIAPMIEQIVGKVDGAGWTIALGTSAAMVEQTWFLYMPQGKTGLTSIIGAASDRPTVPSFVSPESTSYVTVNLDPSAVRSFVHKQLQNPMLGQGMDPQQMEDIEKRISDVCATLGKHLHVASRIVRPLATDSTRVLIAMECTKPQEFENLIAQEAPQMGLESRDFLGQRIFSIDTGGAGNASDSWSLGIGGGYVIAGPSSEVELALRAINAKEPATLEDDADFKQVVQAVGSDKAVAWAFADMVETIESNMRVSVLHMKDMAEQMREFAPDYADEYLEQAKAEEAKLDDMPSVEVLRQYIGPAAWFVRSIDEGFVGKSYILPGKGE